MSRFAILAAFGLVISAPMSAQSVDPSVKAGIDAWARGDFDAAVGIWRPLADSGDADARFNMGQAYRLGRGVDRDLARAQGLFEDAAGAGHLEAQAVLGLMLFNNGNRTSALRWLKQAAEGGEPRALLVYGTALYNGDDLPRDTVRAYAFVSRAAAQGLAPAKTTLDEMDKLLPIATRQRGVELAQTLVAQSRDRTPAPATKPDPAPIKVAEAKPKPEPKPAPAKKEAPKPKPKPKAEPAKTESTPAPTKVATKASGWRVQLGAFSKSGSADDLYDKVKGIGALSGTRKMLEPAGKVTRLQVGPFTDKAAANKACSALQAAGHACFPVAP